MTRTERSAPAPALVVIAMAALAAIACAGDGPLAPDAGQVDAAAPTHHAADPVTVTVAQSNACWGQATRVFAQLGAMGEHASGQANPRIGLRNLARTLAEAGIIPDDSMASLGAFVASELGLDISACR